MINRQNYCYKEKNIEYNQDADQLACIMVNELSSRQGNFGFESRLGQNEYTCMLLPLYSTNLSCTMSVAKVKTGIGQEMRQFVFK